METKMKKSWCVALSLGCVMLAGNLRTAAAAEELTDEELAVGVFLNPLAMVLGYYGAELAISPMHLLSVNIGGWAYSNDSGGVETTGWSLEGGPQFFVTGDRPMHGMYVYPRLSYATAEAKNEVAEASATLVGLGSTVGYQWNWQPFAFRVGGGLMYYSVVAEGDGGSGDDPEISLEGVAPAIDLTIGFVF
jgi:hypothetical protein